MQLIVVVPLLCAPGLRAQAAADPSGHWEGAVRMPGQEIKIEIDLARNAGGEFTGTISVPGENQIGIPIRSVSVEGNSIRFQARADQPFAGALSADGEEISGDYTIEGHLLPFDLARTGAAQMHVSPTIAPIRKELEGAWEGTLSAEGKEFWIGLMLANGADGKAIGKAVSFNEGELEIPVSAITQADSYVVIEFQSLGASYTAKLDTERAEMAGTYRKGELVGPLTLRRVATKE